MPLMFDMGYKAPVMFSSKKKQVFLSLIQFMFFALAFLFGSS